jgi:hypothetical protein
MQLSNQELQLHDLIGKTLEMPGGEKLLQQAKEESDKMSKAAERQVCEMMRSRCEQIMTELENVLEKIN